MRKNGGSKTEAGVGRIFSAREGYMSVCKKVGRDRLPVSFLENQLLTGHGNLTSFLQRFRESGRCACRVDEETTEHVRDVYVEEDKSG